MPTYKTLSEAMAYIQKAIEDVLHNEVFEKVKEVELSHITSDVYGAYPKPKMYSRRKSGGFSDPNNIQDVGGGLVLEVVNNTPPNPDGSPPPTTDKDLAQVIESGSGYDYFSPGARPYHENTINDLAGSGAHVDALKTGLLKKGIKIG